MSERRDTVLNLLDIVLILIMVFIACIGASRGFFKSLAGVIAYVASAFISKIAALPAAESVYNGFLREKILTALNEAFPSGSVQGEVGTALGKAAAALPSYIGSAIEYFSPTASDSSAVLTVAEIETSYVLPVAVKLLTWAAAAVIFILCAALLRAVLGALDKVLFHGKNQGMLSWVNKILGFLLGAVKAVLTVFAVCLLMNLICPIFDNGGFADLVSDSALCGLAAQIF